MHIRTHTDILPYKCDHCSKEFREKGSLERHVRTHTGEKPYKCKHCGRTFAEHGTLNRHLRAKGELDFPLCLFFVLSLFVFRFLLNEQTRDCSARRKLCEGFGQT